MPAASTPPPAANGTIKFIARLGQFSALTGGASVSTKTTAQNKRLKFMRRFESFPIAARIAAQYR
jgi:hypothetical protein